MKNISKSLFVLALTLALCGLAFGQATTTSTTFSVAVASGDNTVNLTSATGVTAASQGAYTWMLFVDRELMGVRLISGTVAQVDRGVDGTKVSPHTTTATVWEGPPSYFSQNNNEPTGGCYLPGTSVSEAVNQPRFFEVTGNGWICPTSGPRAGQWTMQYPAPGIGNLSIDNSQSGTFSALKVCHATYLAGTDGGTAGTTYTPPAARNCVIPANALIYWSFVVNTVAPTVTSTDTLSVGLSAGASGTAAVMAATNRALLVVNSTFQGKQIGTTASTSNTTYTKMSAAGSVTVTPITSDITVGTLNVYIYYIDLPA